MVINNINYELEGLDDFKSLEKLLINSDISRIEIPFGQTLRNSYLVRLYLECGSFLEIHGLAERVRLKEEYGSLKVCYMLEGETTDRGSMTAVEFSCFKVQSLQKIIYKSESVYCESGISLKNDKSEEIIILASDMPCALTIKLQTHGLDSLDAEFEYEEYTYGE